MATSKKVKVRFIKAPAAMNLAYHPPQEAELSEALAKEVVNNGFAEYVEDPAPKKATRKPAAKK